MLCVPRRAVHATGFTCVCIAMTQGLAALGGTPAGKGMRLPEIGDVLMADSPTQEQPGEVRAPCPDIHWRHATPVSVQHCIPAILCRSPAHVRVTWPQDHADENGTDGQTVGAAGATQHQEDDPYPDPRSPVSVHCPLLTLTHVRRKLVMTNGSTHDVWHCSSCRYREVCWTLRHANSIRAQQIPSRTALSPRLKRRACVRCLQCMSHVRFATQRTHPIGLRSSCVTARHALSAPAMAALVPCHDARAMITCRTHCCR